MTWITADFPHLTPEAKSKFTAITTTREGGVSAPPYNSFNVASHVGDNRNAVIANRALLRELVNMPTEPYWLNQTHSNNVVELPYHFRPAANLEADASYTKVQNVVCASMTADCLPLLIVDQDATEVAAIHAGWRGLENGVIKNTITSMSSAPETLHVWLGPAIGPNAFEVGNEVKELFVNQNKAYQTAFKQQPNNKFLCDVFKLARMQLSELGVTNVSGGDLCTYTDQNRFYSYRRDGVTGRLASLIWLHKDN